jgi:YidC/Oxa1 family membrane protein insertase
VNDRRILYSLGAALVIALAFTYAGPTFFDDSPVPQTTAPEGDSADTTAPERAAEEPAPAPRPRRTATASPAARPPEQKVMLRSDDFVATLSTRGGTLSSFRLLAKKYRRVTDRGTKQVDLVSTEREKWLPLRLGFREADFAYQEQNVDYRLVSSDDRHAVFEWSSAEVRIRRLYEVKDPYQLLLTTEITNLGQASQSHKLELETFRYVRAEDEEGKFFSQSPWVVSGVCEHGGEVTRHVKGDMWHETSNAGRIGFAAADDLYFVQTLLPKAGTRAECRMKARALPEGSLFRVSLVYAKDELAAGATSRYETRAYFGPKDHDGLARIDPELQHLVDFGFLAPLCVMLLHVLQFFYGYVGNWGIAIILLTVAVKILLYPLSQKSFKSMREMQRVKPIIDGINAKYPDDKDRRNQALMQVYKEHKINPFGGCLPILLQMPIGLALYATLWRAIELYQEPFTLWWVDLSSPDPYFVLPLILGVTMFIQQKMTPTTMDPAQQRMMQWFMPIMFTAFMLFLPVGLTVYILTNTLLTIAQQQALYRRHPLPATVPVAPTPTPPTEDSRARQQRPARRRG